MSSNSRWRSEFTTELWRGTSDFGSQVQMEISRMYMRKEIRDTSMWG